VEVILSLQDYKALEDDLKHCAENQAALAVGDLLIGRPSEEAKSFIGWTLGIDELVDLVPIERIAIRLAHGVCLSGTCSSVRKLS
jgi:hypothetical protein